MDRPTQHTCVHLNLLCLYAGRRCNNLRASKRSGLLHNLCEHHRERAKLYQQQSVRRRRDATRQINLSRYGPDGWTPMFQFSMLSDGEGDDFVRVIKKIFNLSYGNHEAVAPPIAELEDGDDEIAVENEWLAKMLDNISPEEFDAIVHSAPSA